MEEDEVRVAKVEKLKLILEERGKHNGENLVFSQGKILYFLIFKLFALFCFVKGKYNTYYIFFLIAVI